MSFLLAISLGPVQEFIAAARKTRDLWYGSALLADLARSAARALADGGAELIFPDLTAGGDSAPVANKLLAIVPDAPAERAAHARRAAEARLLAARDDALAVARERGLMPLLDRSLLDQQLDGFLEWFAAWWPYTPAGPDSYPEARRQVEALLAGRKALRDFVPAAGRDRTPKSSLDGGRETVFHTGRLTDPQLVRADVRRGELLDGVSLIKRLAPAPRFVSVSRITVDPWLRRFGHDDALIRQLREIAGRLVDLRSPLAQRFPPERLKQFEAFPFDTQLFFNDGAVEKDLDQEEYDLGRRFFQLVQQRKPAPSSYLAVLVADGDRVGAALGALDSPAAHRAFSRAGAAFAAEAETVIAHHQGALVYSGGDDVLALLPLDTCLEAAGALRAVFDAAFSGLGLAPPLTLSVGLAIGHFGEPLQQLLAWGREAEARAKRERASLAVVYHTRSGGNPAVACRPWNQEPLARLVRWAAWFGDDLLPDGAAYELRTLARELRGLHEAGGKPALAMLAPEARRILSRKRGVRGSRALSENEIGIVLATLNPNDSTTLESLDELVDELLIARQIARAREGSEKGASEVSYEG